MFEITHHLITLQTIYEFKREALRIDVNQAHTLETILTVENVQHEIQLEHFSNL